MPHASPPPSPSVVAIAYDGLCTFEFGIAVEVFGLPRPEFAGNWYRFAVAAAEPGPLRGLGGVEVAADGGLELLETAGLVVIPGWRGFRTPVPLPLIDSLRRAGERGCRFLSICSGVVVLAEAGLLNGRRATTHWRYTDELAQRYPAVTVEPTVLYVEDGDIVTSAGSAAGIDACLHVVSRDFGARSTNHVARRLVVPPHRDGGQAQYIERPVARDRERSALGGLFDWVRAHLHEALTIERLARQAGMAQRTFLRRFHEATGTGPGEWLVRERLNRARELLEEDDLSVEMVAELSGFGSAATLRHHFRTRLGTTPSAYRTTFSRAFGGRMSAVGAAGDANHATTLRHP